MGSKSSFLRKVLTLSLVLISFSIVLTSVSINSPWPGMEVGQAASTTTYYVDPSSVVDPALTPGNTFTVDVKVSDADWMFSWQVYMAWDASVLSVDSYVFGGFLTGQPEGSSTNVRIEPNFLLFSEATMGSYTGISAAEGLLFSVTFLVESEGETILDISSDLTKYLYCFQVPMTETRWPARENGYFSNIEAATHTLTVNSDPISGIDFTVDGTPHTTSWSDSLSEGSHTVVMPSSWGDYIFDHWEDASTDLTRIVSLTSDTTVTAYYEYVPATHSLTVNSDPITGVEFTVDGSPHTTSWSDTLGEGSHTVVMPSSWGMYDFVEWEDASTNPTRIVSLTADKIVTAYFVKREWTLTVDSDPISSVEFTVDGAPHTTSWSDLLDEGSYTVVMPSPWTIGEDVYNFDHWEDASTNPTRIISLTADKTVTAYYVLLIPQYELIIDVVGSGSTVPSPGTYLYDAGTEASVASLSDPGWMLDHWEVDDFDVGAADPYNLIMNANHTLTAFFVEILLQYELTVNSDPISGVDFTVDGSPHTTPWSDTLGEGSHTVVMPSTWGVYDFVEWEDASTNPTRIISLTADKIVTAYYVKRQWTLTVNSDPISSVEFTVDGSPHTTPWSDTLGEGSHTVVMPSTWGDYNFDHWEDASTDLTRIVSLTSDTTVTAYYEAREWTLTVESDPISGIDFTVDGTPHTTSWSDDLVEGSHMVVMPSSWSVYDFDHWEDASTDPTRIISLTSNTAITAYYTLAPVGETVVAVDPPISTADPDQYFTINLTIVDVTDLYSWGARIKWSAGLLSTHQDNVTEGSFLLQGGSTSFTKKVFLSYIDIGSTLIGAVPGVTGSGTLATITFKVLKGGNCTLELDPAKATLYNTSFGLIDRTLQDGYFYTNCPVAKFTYTPHPIEYYGRPIVGETITFDGTLSYDPDEPYDATPGGILSYEWDFGDATTGTGGTPTHVYDEPGSYTVSLNVTDDEGKWGFINKDIYGSPSVRVQLHDIAVINVTVTPTTFTPGAVLTINVTALNNGTETEYLNVTVYTDSDPVKTVTFLHKVGMSWTPSLLPDQNGTTIIEWDTTGISPGDYTLKVYAFLIKPTTKESVPDIEESEALSDNWMTYGTITVIGPDFELTASPTSLSIQQGSSNTSTITITSLNDFNDLVSLSVSGVPSEVTVILDPEQVTPPPNGTANSTLTVSVGLAATPGSYTLTINATSGTLEHSVNIALEITELPPTQHQLTINSDPITGVEFTVDGSPHTTSWSDLLDEGSYTVVMPSVWTVGEDSYNFDHWEDASTSPTRIVSLTSDTTVTAYYVYVPATHSLTVNSDPISGVDFTVDGSPHTTPWSDTLGEGSHTVVMPSSWGIYDFVEWEDASTNPTRIVSLTADKTVTAYFVEPVHDIAILDVVPFTLEVVVGDSVDINVTVMNEGMAEETFTVNTYAGVELVDTTPWALDAGAEDTLTFTWTTSITGSFIISAEVPPVPGETDTTDNMFIDGEVTVIPRTTEHPVEVDDVVFYVFIESNSTVSDFTFNQTLKQISFNVTGPDGTVGFCNVTIPKALLGDPFTALIDGTPLPYELTENATHYFLYFTYNHSIHAIQIIGTTVATPPIASLTYSPSTPVVGETVAFNASESNDPDGTIVSYSWNFGDSTTDTGMIVNHTYTAGGTYAVTLTVMDNDGLSDIVFHDVTVTGESVLTATVTIDPNTLNLKSKGKWITCHITLPEGYKVSDIDVSTILLDGVIPAGRGEILGDTLMVKFARADVIQYIKEELRIAKDEVTLTITGNLTQGTAFEGKDTIRVLLK